MQPDSLKLCSQLAILKVVHWTAFRLEVRLGDRPAGKTSFLKGIQGEVSRPAWNRDYFYLNAKVQQVRQYLVENCVHTVLEDLFNLALDIFSRYDNRRRMGVEVMVLCILASPALTSFRIPDKYHTSYFVIDMLVSCRHRFQKPSAAFFWSKQSEALLMSTFRQATRLSRLSLPLCNDLLLKAIAVYCRNLVELEVQLALDATEEGLLAVAGRSALEYDQGLHHRYWDTALYLHRDFGPAKDWYVKDALLFTPPPAAAKRLAPLPRDRLLPTFPTDFGCTRLRRFRLSGDFVFPAMAARSKVPPKKEAGPVVEAGLFIILLHLRQLQQFCVSFAPLVVAQLASLLPAVESSCPALGLTELSLGWEEALTVDELEAVARLCPHLVELHGVSAGVLEERYHGEKHLQEAAVCSFIHSFKRLERLTSSLQLSCLNSYLATAGQNLTSLNCSAHVLFTADILVLRRFCVSLEKLEGRFSLDNTVDRTAARASHRHHEAASRAGVLLPAAAASSSDLTVDSPWAAWRPAVGRWPWRALRHLDLNGRINCRLLQILVAAADRLETLAVTNRPNEMVAGGMAFDDSWIAGLLEANALSQVRELTIRMESDHYVEEGFLTRASLALLLHHAAEHCPKLEKVVGEWTQVPDREMSLMEEEARRKGLNVRIRNAEPYREFQNTEDNDRFYGVNEGYWRNQAVNPLQPQNEEETTNEEIQFRHKRVWGYIYRPYRSEPTDQTS